MNTKKLSNYFFSLLLMILAVGVTACSDDDEQQNGWYITVDTELSSANFNSNLYVQMAVSGILNTYNEEFRQTMMSEKDAKNRFETFCTELENKVNAMGLPVLENTYCTVYLTHTTSTPNEKGPVLSSKKIYFKESSK